MSWALITVCGYLGADPTLKTFDKGAIVCNFVLYVSHRKSNDDQPPMKFHVEVWGKQAETCINFLKKGANPTVCGTLDEDTFVGRDGNPVTVKTIRFAQVIDFGSKVNSPNAEPSEPS